MGSKKRKLKLSYTPGELATLSPEDRKRFDKGAEATFMRVDREYFELNPSATSYTRLSLPGEFAAPGQYLKPESAVVTVTQVAKGVRRRSFVFPEGYMILDGDMLHHDLEAERG